MERRALGWKTPLRTHHSLADHKGMKQTYQRIAILVFPLLASVLLSSCDGTGFSTGELYTSSGTDHGVYTTLPSSFVGNAYYHDGRYYSGGNYQTGRYDYGGRQYTNRYRHNGKYIYGGEYKQFDRSSHRSRNRYSSRLSRGYHPNYRMGGRTSYMHPLRRR